VLVGSWKSAMGLRRMSRRRFAHRKNGWYRFLASCVREALNPACRICRKSDDRRLVHVRHPSLPDLASEPLLMDTAEVLHHPGITAILLDQMLGQEPLDRRVDRHVPVGPRFDRRRLVHFGHERHQRPRRLSRRVGPVGSVQPMHLAVRVATGRDP
jgi:hypothetical protein